MKRLFAFFLLFTLILGFNATSYADTSRPFEVKIIANYWNLNTGIRGDKLYTPYLKIDVRNLHESAVSRIKVKVIFYDEAEKKVWSEETNNLVGSGDSPLKSGYSKTAFICSSVGYREKINASSLPDVSAEIYVNDTLYGLIDIEKSYNAKATNVVLNPKEEITEKTVRKIDPTLKAEDVNVDEMSTEELLKLQEAIAAVLESDRDQEQDAYPEWTGNGKVSIYEDEYIAIEFNGFYKWTNSWYIPNLIISNKTDTTVNFVWSDVFLNSCNIGAANSSLFQDIVKNGKLSFASSHLCSITLSEFVELYGDTTINLFQVSFYVKETGSDEHLVDGLCGVTCNIDINELMGTKN